MISPLHHVSALHSRKTPVSRRHSLAALRFGLVSVLVLGFASSCGRNAQVIGDETSGLENSEGGTDSGGHSSDDSASGGATLDEGGASSGGSFSDSGGFSSGGVDAQGNGGVSEGEATEGGGASQGGFASGGATQLGGASQGGATQLGGANQGGFTSGGATQLGGASSGGGASTDCGCGESEFCDRESCEADAPGECAIKHEVCAANYAPVCGCDGRTYGNDCGRQSAGVSLDHAGECECRVADVQCRTVIDGETTFEEACCSGYSCVPDPEANGNGALLYFCQVDACAGCGEGEICLQEGGAVTCVPMAQ